MIIKFIAENDADKARLGGQSKLEHYGVKEYFVVGNKIDSEDGVYDFHDWHGGFKYLLGELQYYYQVVNDERRAAGNYESNESPIRGSNIKQRMVKRGDANKIQPIDMSEILSKNTKSPLAISVEDPSALGVDEIAPRFPNLQIVTNATNEAEAEAEAEEDKDASIGKRGLRIVPPSIE